VRRARPHFLLSALGRLEDRAGVGFVAGVIAKLLHPGNKYEPSGFIVTTVLGIVGAFVATYLGQAVGWYQAGESAGFIGAIVGAIIVLIVWGMIAPRLQRT
jgi:uncharacterized membrane protein YeaQ/YmgE (transglycosylase-associated protein family)